MQKLKKGDKVRLTCDFPDPSPYHPQHLYTGDTGTIEEHNGILGFCSNRIGGVHLSQMLDGKRVNLIDYCELVEAPQTVLAEGWFLIENGRLIPSSPPDENGIAYPLKDGEDG